MLIGKSAMFCEQAPVYNFVSSFLQSHQSSATCGDEVICHVVYRPCCGWRST